MAESTATEENPVKKGDPAFTWKSTSSFDIGILVRTHIIASTRYNAHSSHREVFWRNRLVLGAHYAKCTHILEVRVRASFQIP